MKNTIIAGSAATVIGGLILMGIQSLFPMNKNSMYQDPFGNSHIIPNGASKIVISSEITSINSEISNDSIEKKILPEVQDIYKRVESKLFEEFNISLSGSNNDLYLSAGDPNSRVPNLSISGSNLDREIEIPKGQTVSLRVIGTNNNIKIDKSIYSQIIINEMGSNNEISKVR